MISSSILVAVGMTASIQLYNTLNVIAIKVSNKSQYDILYSGFGTLGQEWIVAGTEYVLSSSNGNQGVLRLEAFNTVNINPAPPAAIIYTIYSSGDRLPLGNWPVSIPFQTVSAAIVTTTAQYVKDDIDPAGTVFVESTVVGDGAGSAFSVTVDGIVTIGNVNHNGDLKFFLGSLSRISVKTAVAMGNGKTVVNHGLGVIPDWVILTNNSSGAIPNPPPVAGYNPATMTSTTVDIWCNGLFNFDVITIKS